MDHRKDSFLLDGGRLDEAVAVYASEHALLEAHIVEIFNCLFPVSDKLFFFYTQISSETDGFDGARAAQGC